MSHSKRVMFTAAWADITEDPGTVVGAAGVVIAPGTVVVGGPVGHGTNGAGATVGVGATAGDGPMLAVVGVGPVMAVGVGPCRVQRGGVNSYLPLFFLNLYKS